MYRTNVVHKMVQINSANADYGTTTNFTINLDNRDMDRVTSVTMIKASLPRLFPNIWSVNNTIDIQHPAGIDNFFTVPPGQYNTSSLTTALNTATSGINVSWTYTSPFFTATYSGVGSVVLKASSSTIGPLIGLTSDVTLGAPSALPSSPQLSGPDNIYIRSNLVAANSCVANGSLTSIPLVGIIPFNNVPYGFTGNFNSSDLTVGHIEYPSQVVMRRIDIQLTDELGNEIMLPANAFLDMILQFSYIQV